MRILAALALVTIQWFVCVTFLLALMGITFLP